MTVFAVSTSARDADPQPALRGTAVHPVVGVGRVVDQHAPLLEPGVNGIPRDPHKTWRRRLRFARKVYDRVGGECVTEGMVAPMHHQCALGVDDHMPIAQRLNAARVRFDEHDGIEKRGREPARGTLAERTTSGNETHVNLSTAR